MKPVMMILGALLLILFMGAVFTGIILFRSDSRTEDYDVVTGGGASTATIVLTQDLLDNATAYVSALSSNQTLDAPVASSYASATKTLTVAGLAASLNHRLTITYRYNQLGEYWAADIGTKAIPLMIILGIFGIIGGAVYQATKGSES